MSKNNYVFIINKDGGREASVLETKHRKGDDLMQYAKNTYPNFPIYLYVEDGDSMIDEFIAGKVYINGQMTEPPVIEPSNKEQVEQQIQELNAEFKAQQEELLESMRLALLEGNTDMQAEVQACYAELKQMHADSLAELTGGAE